MKSYQAQILNKVLETEKERNEAEDEIEENVEDYNNLVNAYNQVVELAEGQKQEIADLKSQLDSA